MSLGIYLPNLACLSFPFEEWEMDEVPTYLILFM